MLVMIEDVLAGLRREPVIAAATVDQPVAPIDAQIFDAIGRR